MDYHLISAPTATSTGTTATVTSEPVSPASVICVAVGMASNTATSVVSSTAGGGTWVKVASQAGASRAMELWIGYGFTGVPVTFQALASASGVMMAAAHLAAASALDATPMDTDSAGATGTSTTATTGEVTPTIGDVVLCGVVWASTTAASAISGTGTPRIVSSTTSASSTRVLLTVSLPENTTPTGMSATIPSVAWAGIASTVTLPPPADPTPAAVIKGRLTATADAGNTVP